MDVDISDGSYLRGISKCQRWIAFSQLTLNGIFPSALYGAPRINVPHSPQNYNLISTRDAKVGVTHLMSGRLCSKLIPLQRITLQLQVSRTRELPDNASLGTM